MYRPHDGRGYRGGGGGGRGRGRGGGRGGHHGGGAAGGTEAMGQQVFDGKRMRKPVKRPTIDYIPTLMRYLENRVWQHSPQEDVPFMQPDENYIINLQPPVMLEHQPASSVTTRWYSTSVNKIKCPVFSLKWTPEGRRLVTGISSGEFTLWNGFTFNFETILQAHEKSVRAMVWSYNKNWMLTGDDSGNVKYWQANMNNVAVFNAHKEKIRKLTIAPTDQKIATCSDDGSVRVFDFARTTEERVLRGHGADVTTVDWHPRKGLIVSGSKDAQQPIRLWDPKAGKSLCTLHLHKNTVTNVQWNKNGNWLLTASTDNLIKAFDLRAMKEFQVFRGNKREVTAIAWHPVHETMFASGAGDGAMMFWSIGQEHALGSMARAHDQSIWSLDWHPLGHILASGSNDCSTKFWTRNRPGDPMDDKYNSGGGYAASRAERGAPSSIRRDQPPMPPPGASSNLPGMGHSTPQRHHSYQRVPPQPSSGGFNAGASATAAALPGLGNKPPSGPPRPPQPPPGMSVQAGRQAFPTTGPPKPPPGVAAPHVFQSGPPRPPLPPPGTAAPPRFAQPPGLGGPAPPRPPPTQYSQQQNYR